MDANRLIKELQLHPLFSGDVTMQMQFGLPMLERKNGRILLSFKLHNEQLNQKSLEYYPAAYEITFDIPSLKVVSFSNLVALKGVEIDTPIAVADFDYIVGEGAEIINEVYNWLGITLDKLYLSDLEDDPVVTYNQIFDEAVKALGLSELYK